MTDGALEFHAWPPRTGGQQAVQTHYGVLVIHLPTGLAAVSTSERSQMTNRAIAVARLRAAIAVIDEARAACAVARGDSNMEVRMSETIVIREATEEDNVPEFPAAGFVEMAVPPSDSGPIVLSAEDFDRVIEMIENPEPPTQALIDLMRGEADER